MQPADASLLIGMILILFFNMLHVLKYCSTKSKFYMILFRYEAILDAIDSIYQEKNDPEVLGLRTLLTSKNSIAVATILRDIL